MQKVVQRKACRTLDAEGGCLPEAVAQLLRIGCWECGLSAWWKRGLSWVLIDLWVREIEHWGWRTKMKKFVNVVELHWGGHTWKGRNYRSRMGYWGMKGRRKDRDGICLVVSSSFASLGRLVRDWDWLHSRFLNEWTESKRGEKEAMMKKDDKVTPRSHNASLWKKFSFIEKKYHHVWINVIWSACASTAMGSVSSVALSV